MATSLAEQLKKLRTPQTKILHQDKKRASLLFDPREAANLDKETVLSIGNVFYIFLYIYIYIFFTKTITNIDYFLHRSKWIARVD